ncbi:unnamed protein product [Rotaria sp. Silwood1]|nr:unnamed protein product [Rotaria sp. Silwood1]CAF1609424.1 unnamed protein product [Rotaria sp. Silwood1]
MSAIREDLSTIVETGTQSGLDIIEEIECDDHNDDDESLEEIAQAAVDNNVDKNRVHMFCNNVQNCFSEIDNSMFELLELKDKLLLQYIPLNVSLKITLVLSRLYRAYSQAQVPIYELIRLVQLYSQPFDMKCIQFKRLYDSNEMKKRLLNMAFQRLTSIENNTKKYEEQKCINNWEKMYIRLALPRSNVRKWKFRLKTFQEKAALGYEHVIKWIHPRIPRSSSSSSSSDISSNSQLNDEQETDRFQTIHEISHMQLMDKQKLRADHGSNDDEIGSNNNEVNRIDNIRKQELNLTEQKPTVITNDMEIQVQPDINHQQTSTEDILSTKSLIMRIYRPIGILKTKFQCIVYAQGQIYKTNVFKFNKPNVSIDENKKTKGQFSISRTTKLINSKTKKRSETPTISDDNDINTFDKEQHDEILIPMLNVLKRRSLFHNNIDPDAIKIDIFGDEKFCGSLIFSSEDLHMFDLPNLHNSILSSLIAVDDNISITSLESYPYDFDQTSNKLYQLWNSRAPQLFSIYNTKHESIGKLPLIMFWYTKIEQTHATKCTMTIPIESDVPTPKILPVQKSEINERVISPINDEGNKSNGFEIGNDRIEILKTAYENEIAKLHEDYQAEIYRLTNLLNELLSQQSNQMIEIPQSDENQPEMIQESPLNINIRQQLGQNTKREVVMENQPSPVYGRDLPKNFLDRYQIYRQRSIIHRQQLIAKVEQETTLANERQMETQHRLHRSKENNEDDEDLCLPAVFMPFRSGNVFNPRAYQYFHSIGSTDPRLTQAPSILKLPSVPSRTVSVLNLFELSQRYDTSNEKDHLIEKKN